ncbi:MAG: hypothetical protein H5T86_01680 [Armatimonadetes bacterium]|nr:hypothetical protein [Armatimonadota bacterium]
MALATCLTALWAARLLFTAPIGLLALSMGADQRLQLTEDFSRYPDGEEPGPPWIADGFMWEVRSGVLHVVAPEDTRLQLRDPRWYRRLHIQAKVTVLRPAGRGWKVVGVAAIHDSEHFWHAALIESPDDAGRRHFFEVAMRLPGAWPCRDGVTTVADSGGDYNWQYNHPYRIVVDLEPGKISARLEELDGTVRSEKIFALATPAVQDGSPALRAAAFEAEFDDVRIAASEEAGVPMSTPKEYPPVSVPTIRAVKGRKSGFFHVEQIDGIWWVIAPNGEGFYAIGTDHVRYEGHWCQSLGYAPYGRNTQALYGSEERWAEVATARLRRWNFNLLGAGHSSSCRYRGLAHTEFISFGSGYAGFDPLVEKVHWTGFPNVFSPNWPRWCDKQAWKICRPNREDPWLFGYFLDNELEWWGKGGGDVGLAIEAAKLPPDNPAKKALVEILRQRHGSIEALNKAWGATYRSWDELAAATKFDAQNTQALRDDQLAYVALAADLYFKHCTEAIRRHDPNHLILGCRFAGDAPPGVWEAAGRYCDIVTFNYYGRVDILNADAPGTAEQWTRYYEKARRPLMITEWSFPALDAGLPCKHGAGMRVDTQQQKALCYEVYQRLIFGLPFMVGSDYFMWVDEPALGIHEHFPEDSNYGLVNEKDEPYEELTQTATRVNAMAYELHSGDAPEIELREVKERGGRVCARVANTGRRPASFQLQFSVNGREAERVVVRLAPKQEEWVAMEHQPLRPAYVSATADPDRVVPERNFKNNRASALLYKPAPWLPPASTAKKWVARWPLMIASGAAPVEAGTILTVAADELKKFGSAEEVALRLAAYDLSGRQVPCQLEPWDDGWQIAISAPRLPPHSGTLVYVYMADSPMGAAFQPGLRVADASWSFDNGLLLLEGTRSGNIVDRISYRQTPLGRLNPLVWENRAGTDLWVQTARTARVTAFEGAVGLAAEVWCASLAQERPITQVDEQGKMQPPPVGPHRFTVVHRIHVPRGVSWFMVQFRSLSNDDREPMELRGWFYYLLSAIGGDVSGDVLGGPDVPNHWLNVGAWKDEKVGLTLGELAVPDARLSGWFWVDGGGGQHPDLRRALTPPVALQPGKTFFEQPDAPAAIVFAGPADARPWQEAARIAASLHGAQVKLLAAEQP